MQKLVFNNDLVQYAEESKPKIRPFNFKSGLEKSYLLITTNIDYSSQPSFLISVKSQTNSGFVNFAGSCIIGSAVAHNLGTSNIVAIYITSISNKLGIALELNREYFKSGQVEVLAQKANNLDTLPVYNQVTDVAVVDGSESWVLLLDDIQGVKYSNDSISFTILTANETEASYPDTTRWTSIRSAGKFATDKYFAIADNSNIELTDEFSTNFDEGTEESPITIPLDLKTVFPEAEDSDLTNIQTVTVNKQGLVVGVSKDIVPATANTVGGILVGYNGNAGMPVLLDENNNAYVATDGAYISKYGVLPTAFSHKGEIVQYVGTTSADYVNGYFYKSVQYPLRVASFSQEGLYYFDNGVTSAKKLLDNNYRRNSLLTDTGNPILWTISAYNIASINASTVVGDITFTLTDSAGIYEYRLSYDDLADWGISISKAATDTIGDKLNKLTQTISMSLSSSWHWELWNTQPAVANWNGVDITFITNLEIDNMMGTLANY